MRGLFVEVASIIALIAGVYGAIHFSHFASGLLSEQFQWDENYINIAAFAITFIVIVLLIALAGKALTKLADFAALGIFNRILGGIFVLLKVGLILSIIIMIIENYKPEGTVIDKDLTEDSTIYPWVKVIAPSIFPAIIEAAENIDETIKLENE